MNQLDRDALDAQQEGRGLCRVLVWLGVAAWIGLAVLACGCRHLPGSPVDEPEPSPDEVAFADLRWEFGGFDGSTASLADGVRIADLRVEPRLMRYAWTAGGCEVLGGAVDAQDWTRTLACLFYRDASGQWVGGKFDWISTSRTTRDFHNINTGYGGWNADGFLAAREFAFVVVSSDGRRRSNVIGGTRK